MKAVAAIGGLILVVGILGLLAIIIISPVSNYMFNRACGDYLKLAADAPTVERANGFLGTALVYMERRGMTHGNSAFVFQKPSTDVGVWYGQVKGAKTTLESIIAKGDGASQLEKDNALIKVREVLLDQGDSGTAVTLPVHINLFPSQGLYFAMLWLTIGLIVLGVIIIWLGYRSSY